MLNLHVWTALLISNVVFVQCFWYDLESLACFVNLCLSRCKSCGYFWLACYSCHFAVCSFWYSWFHSFIFPIYCVWHLLCLLTKVFLSFDGLVFGPATKLEDIQLLPRLYSFWSCHLSHLLKGHAVLWGVAGCLLKGHVVLWRVTGCLLKGHAVLWGVAVCLLQSCGVWLAVCWRGMQSCGVWLAVC